MRRMFNATTAIVASLSLLAPDLVAAQQSGGNQNAEDGVQIVPKKQRNPNDARGEAQQNGAADDGNAEAPQPRRNRKNAPSDDAQPEHTQFGDAQADDAQPDDATARQGGEAAEKPRAPRRQQADDQTAVPEAEAPAANKRAQDRVAPAARPARNTAEPPKPRPQPDASEPPAPAQRQVDDTAPAPAPRQERRNQRPAEPDQAELEKQLERDGQNKPARRKSAAEQGSATQNDDRPAASPENRAERLRLPTGDQDNAAEQERASQERAEPAPRRAPRERPSDQAQSPDDQKPADAPIGNDPDALRRALGGEDAPRLPRADNADNTDGAKPNPDRVDADRTPIRPRRAPDAAPETDAVENDAARAAANPKPPAPSEALRALTDGGRNDDAPRGQRSDFNIREDDTRRSDEDFVTSVGRSLDADEVRELRERRRDDDPKDNGRKDEARKDDDDHGRDLARLALAGLAGYAVGSWMSNNRQVALNTGDRVVVTMPDGSQQLIKNDDTLLFRPGSNVQTESYDDGSSITTVLREDGSRVVTIRDANMNILRRSVVWPDGRSTMLIDDTADVAPVRVSELPPPARPIDYSDQMSETALRDALMRESGVDRRFTLGQIRDIAQVRALVAPLDIQSITFDTGSAAITPNQAEQLGSLGRVIAESVRQNPGEMYLIEGYTDAVGSDASNLALSDRRAESVALALTEYFNVPPENMVVQGYGEQFLRVQTPDAERSNRRVAVRRITDLIEQN